MSEAAELNKTIRSRRSTIILGVVSALVLLLVYGGGLIALPLSIVSNYQSKNCDSVLSLDEIYASLYPAFMQDTSLENYVMECAVYTLANRNEEKNAWRDSYDAYRVYVNTYPNGLFVKEANKQSAGVLVELAKDQLSEKKYYEAIGSLNLVLSEYADTNASADTTSLFPEIYTAWGADLRATGDFENAVNVFNEFQAWIQKNQKTEFEIETQRELAKTYLEWGLSLQAQKQFEEAKEQSMLFTMKTKGIATKKEVVVYKPQQRIAEQNRFGSFA